MSFNYYAAENKLSARETGTMYRISLAIDHDRQAELRRADFKFPLAYVLVHYDGYAELWDWHWEGMQKPKGGYRLSDSEQLKLYNAEQDVWEWLSEWRYVELRQIGNEDSEYFATDKLTGKAEISLTSREER